MGKMTEREAIENMEMLRDNLYRGSGGVFSKELSALIETHDLAISALEKQAAKKARWVHIGHDKIYYCSVCDYGTGSPENYCSRCGQRLED